MKLSLKTLAISALFLVPALNAMDQKQKQETSNRSKVREVIDISLINQKLADAAQENNLAQLQSILTDLDRLPMPTALREATKKYSIDSANNKMEMQPLLIAAVNGNTAAIKLLEKHGANIYVFTATTWKYLPLPLQECPSQPTRNALQLAWSHRSFLARMDCKASIMDKLLETIKYLSQILCSCTAPANANAAQPDLLEQQLQIAWLGQILAAQKSQGQAQPASAPAAAKK